MSADAAASNAPSHGNSGTGGNDAGGDDGGGAAEGGGQGSVATIDDAEAFHLRTVRCAGIF